MTLEKALRNLDTTRKIFLSLSPESDRGCREPTCEWLWASFQFKCKWLVIFDRLYCKITFKSSSETLIFQQLFQNGTVIAYYHVQRNVK